jgi:hypothetical protein
VALNYESVVREHQALVDIEAALMLLLRIAFNTARHCINTRASMRERIEGCVCDRDLHWHASQSGLSIEQNWMSVAGAAAS